MELRVEAAEANVELLVEAVEAENVELRVEAAEANVELLVEAVEALLLRAPRK